MHIDFDATLIIGLCVLAAVYLIAAVFLIIPALLEDGRNIKQSAARRSNRPARRSYSGYTSTDNSSDYNPFNPSSPMYIATMTSMMD